jgi:hypothetical protein
LFLLWQKRIEFSIEHSNNLTVIKINPSKVLTWIHCSQSSPSFYPKGPGR